MKNPHAPPCNNEICDIISGDIFFSCVSGKSTFAVQADIQPGGQISWWIWWCGPLPAATHLGEPLVRATCHLICCFLLDLGWSCPSSLAWGEAASLHFSGFKLWFGNTNWHETSCWNQLVPSFAAFPSVFDHLRVSVFHSSLSFFQQSFHRRLYKETLIQSSDFWGNKLSLLKTECVHLSD